MTMLKSLVCAAGVFACATIAFAQSKTVTKPGEKMTVAATIQAIDSTTRQITFRNTDGTEDVVTAGPEVQRFNELKVGDKVTFTYYESTVYQLRKSGSDKMATEAGAFVPGGKKLPGGTMARQTVQTVTVKAVDMSIPSITVTTSDGRTVTRKVDKKSDLEGVKAGDKIDITYTEALLTSVERPK
jgi:hypothetical protein